MSDGKAAAAIGAGVLFVYSGTKGYSVLKAAQNLVQGKGPNDSQTTALISASTPGDTGGGSVPGGNAPAAANASAAQAQAIAKQLIQQNYPQWNDDTNWNDLVLLWNQESGWEWDAENHSSGAYGIPQSLPASKMASAGSDWRTNATTQIRWGLGYISSQYGSPSNAWAHERQFNWY